VYRTLRAANIVRQNEWDAGGNIDLSYTGNEFAGEVSEAIAEAVKLIEEEPDADLSALANELGDVVICIDLIAIRAGLDAVVCDAAIATEGEEQLWVNELGSDLKGVCNTIKKLERARHGMPGSRASIDDLASGLWDVLYDVTAIATCYGINLQSVVADKFNATSEKVGLTTRLAA
jgi:NTP pyrophosphatase (non-canonical NTP hydrolase)